MKNYNLLIAFFLLHIATINAQDIEAGLVAYFPFNGNAIDASGNGNPGQIINALPTEDKDGNPNSAYLFNGIDSYITIPSSESLNRPDSAITMSVWIYLNGYSLVGNNFGPILMKSNSPNNSFSYRLGVSKVRVVAASNNYNHWIGYGTNLILNTWYHLVFSMSETTTKIYLNGVLINDNPEDQIYDLDLNPDNLPLEIGRDVPGNTEIFNGKLDEVRIYDRAISSEEVGLIFGSTATGISKINKKEISIFPNPTQKRITVSNVNQSPFDLIEIFNSLGKKVDHIKFSQTNSQTIDVSNLNPGVYHVRVIGDNWYASSNIVIR
jgi:hypothetical protein